MKDLIKKNVDLKTVSNITYVQKLYYLRDLYEKDDTKISLNMITAS